MAKIDNRSKEAKAAQAATESLSQDTNVSNDNNAAPIGDTTVPAPTTPSVPAEPAISNEDVRALLNTVKALQEEVGALKEASGDKADSFAKAREIYQWPWDYSYKTYGGVPILSYVSRKKDASKDYLYKNHKGEYINNQMVQLTLANGETPEIEVLDLANCQNSPKQRCAVTVKASGEKVYVFSHPEFGEFEVLSNVIN